MHYYWEMFIEPALLLHRPQSIVEIGSENGNTTRLLLAFCEQNDAVLHAIDPQPQVGVLAWQQRYGRRFILHSQVSLVALPTIERLDAVLIDGDHNWYTVRAELHLLDKLTTGRGLPFPLVFFHDIGWPYGRRDLYYDPATIPAEFRQPYARKGMRPGSSALVESGGMNSNMNNALAENTPRNGVLTGIEDYLKETQLELKFLRIPGYHDLGILFSEQLQQQNADLGRFLQSLDLPANVLRYMEMLEAERIHLLRSLGERGEP
jgi:hypothetical protein